VDVLTGLPNRLALEDRAAAEWDRAERYRRPLGVLLLDLDGFKRLNDTRGHAAGDRALCEVATAVQARVRTSDLAVRLGGDEFAVLVPETGPEGLEAMARALEHMSEGLPVGISAGWAAREPDDAGWDEVLARADASMYERKRERSAVAAVADVVAAVAPAVVAVPAVATAS
jgi:diguanylate cyclase (GGDEF)-like protein